MGFRLKPSENMSQLVPTLPSKSRLSKNSNRKKTQRKYRENQEFSTKFAINKEFKK